MDTAFRDSIATSAHAEMGAPPGALSGSLFGMTFDASKVPGGDVAGWGAKCRDKAFAGLKARDWRSPTVE